MHTPWAQLQLEICKVLQHFLINGYHCQKIEMKNALVHQCRVVSKSRIGINFLKLNFDFDVIY